MRYYDSGWIRCRDDRTDKRKQESGITLEFGGMGGYLTIYGVMNSELGGRVGVVGLRKFKGAMYRKLYILIPKPIFQ